MNRNTRKPYNNRKAGLALKTTLIFKLNDVGWASQNWCLCIKMASHSWCKVFTKTNFDLKSKVCTSIIYRFAWFKIFSQQIIDETVSHHWMNEWMNYICYPRRLKLLHIKTRVILFYQNQRRIWLLTLMYDIYKGHELFNFASPLAS